MLGALFVFFKTKLVRDPYRPHMPFKVHYHVEHIVIKFAELVVAFVLWVWLYVVALLLLHYNGPLYFERI